MFCFCICHVLDFFLRISQRLCIYLFCIVFTFIVKLSRFVHVFMFCLLIVHVFSCCHCFWVFICFHIYVVYQTNVSRLTVVYVDLSHLCAPCSLLWSMLLALLCAPSLPIRGALVSGFMYGLLVLSIGDVDIDADGLINAEQFGQLLAELAAFVSPFSIRSLGCRLVWPNLRCAWPWPIQWMGLWPCDDSCAKITGKVVCLYRVEDRSKEKCTGFVEGAMNNPNSCEHASFYNFIINCFVEAHEQCQGRIAYDQCDKFLSRVANVPRNFGFARRESNLEPHTKMFDEFELERGGKGTGHVIALSFWENTVVHVKGHYWACILLRFHCQLNCVTNLTDSSLSCRHCPTPLWPCPSGIQCGCL